MTFSVIPPVAFRNNESDKLGLLQLQNGMIFAGYSFGYIGTTSGECVFQTGSCFL